MKIIARGTYSFRRGVLRLGNQVLPLPIAESYRAGMRVALAILYDYFDGEPNAERKAWGLHYQLGRRITVRDGWSLTQTDLDDIVADILCASWDCKVEIMTAQRRDQIRQLALSEFIFGRRL